MHIIKILTFFYIFCVQLWELYVLKIKQILKGLRVDTLLKQQQTYLAITN